MSSAPSLTKDRLQELRNAAVFIPQPGKQFDAWSTEAQLIGYGGSAGSGKSEIGCGYALQRHQRSLIVRREAAQLVAITDFLTQCIGTTEGLNRQSGVWQLPGDRQIRFGGCPSVGDELRYAGAARDFLFVDEASQFEEIQILRLMAWVRSTDKEQVCRVLLASNPPLDASTGSWMLQWFDPWLNPHNANPAESGELRWYVREGDKEFEVPGGEPVNIGGVDHTPMSRTFIRAELADNKYLATTGYRESLAALPEELKARLLHGDWLYTPHDQAMQVLPSDWVRAAMERSPTKRTTRLTAVGVDPSRGGRDLTVIAARRGWDFEPLRVYEGLKTGGEVAGAVIEVMGESDAWVNLDSIGIGASVLDHLEYSHLGHQVHAINSAAKAGEPDVTGEIKFRNRRSEMWWGLRTLLDVDSPYPVSLPNDPLLFQELTSPTYRVTPGGLLQIESKDDIRRRLSRSIDRADSVIYCSVRNPVLPTARAVYSTLGSQRDPKAVPVVNWAG